MTALDDSNSLTPYWRIQMFGGLILQCGDAETTRFRTRKTGALLAYLAFYPVPQGREKLIDIIWPEATIENGRNNLRVALNALRRQLEDDTNKPLETRSILADRQQIRINSPYFQTDVASFEQLLREAANSSPDERISLLREAFELYKGPLLSGYYEPWIPLEESRLEDLFIKCAQQLISYHVAHAGYDVALQIAHQAARVTPRHEDVPRWLDDLRAKTQNSFRSLLDSSSISFPEASKVEGSDASQESVVLPPTLPSVSNDFFGREVEIETIKRLLATAENRLISLVGEAGCGKTRLAIEIARRHEAYYKKVEKQSPVFFVSLADVAESSFLSNAIAAALPSSTIISVLIPQQDYDFQRALGWLKQFPSCLLILDNLEHLLPMATEIVQQMLQAVPTLCCLVTTRQSLNVSGEILIPVNPLKVPVANEDDSVKLQQMPAVQLFIKRAQERRSDFQITPHNAVSIAALVCRLEGIPLALELCAAQSCVLSPRQMLLQLENQTGESQTDPTQIIKRHNSVRATFDWSYRLLSPPLQQVLRTLSVFRDGFSVEAAQAVAQEDLVLPALAFLRDVSLVQSQEIVTAPSQSEMRFSILETVRDYIEQCLTTDERQIVSERHAQYCMKLAEFVKAAPYGSLPGWSELLDREQDNFWSALEWSSDHHPDCALRLAFALKEYWSGYHPQRGEGAFGILLTKIQSGKITVKPSVHAIVLCYAGEIALRLHRLERARTLLEESLSFADGHENLAQTQIQAFSALGLLSLQENQLDMAHHYFSQALELSRTNDDADSVAWMLCHQGTLLKEHAQYETAFSCLHEAQTLFQSLKDLNALAWVSLNLSNVSATTNDWQQAQSYCENALNFFRQRAHKNGLMWSLHQRGEIARHFNESNARQLFEECLLLAQQLQNAKAINLCLQSLKSLSAH